MNEKSPVKTLKKLKDKIRNLRDAFRKTGASPTYSPYVEDFDEVLGSRDIINTAFAREVEVLNQEDISHDKGKDNLILFSIYFSQGRERWSELKERCTELKVVRRQVFAKPILVNIIHKKLWSNFLKLKRTSSLLVS